MAKIRSLDELTTKELRHSFFAFACQNMEPNNHVFYFCVEQFNAAPSKRKAIFIFEKFLRELLATGTAVNGFDGPTDNVYSLFRPVNVYNTNEYAGQVTAVGTAVGNMKKVKTWVGKLRHRGLVADYANPTAGLFADVQKQIAAVIRDDWFGRFDTTAPATVPGKFPPQIHTASQALTKAGFDPEAMGVY